MSDENDLLVLLRDWETYAEQLTRLKAIEMEKRKLLFGRVFTHTKGSQTTEVAPNIFLKGDAKETVSVKEELIPAVLEALRKEGVSCTELFRYKPSLSMTEYNKLSDRHKTFVDYCCVRSEGAPSLTVKEKPSGD